MFRLFLFLLIINFIAMIVPNGLGLFIILTFFLVFAPLSLLYTRAKYKLKYHKSYPLKSIRKQINEFKFIEKLTFLLPSIKRLSKEFSILTNSIHVRKMNPYPTADYFGDSAYSISVTNMYNSEKKDNKYY